MLDHYRQHLWTEVQTYKIDLVVKSITNFFMCLNMYIAQFEQYTVPMLVKDHGFTIYKAFIGKP